MSLKSSAMKKRLHFVALLIILMWAISASARGQVIILSEDFSGFTSGSHSTPSTSDVSASLNSKMATSGWVGSMIYSAGGEIKIGTTSTPGWIETPVLELSSTGGSFTIMFDIARWAGDATTVQVYYNDIERGAVISPADNFQTVTLKCAGEASSGKVKIRGLTKRFFLDNFSITKDDISTKVDNIPEGKGNVIIYPVPATAEITIEGAGDFKTIDIIDIHSRLVGVIHTSGKDFLSTDISYLEPGIYFLRCLNGKKFEILRLIKSGK